MSAKKSTTNSGATTTKTKSAAPRRTRTKKPKVPKAQQQVSIVVLECGNCGEEDEKVFYCATCGSPMRIVEVVEKEESHVENNDMISKEKAGSEAEEAEEAEEADSTDIDEELGMTGAGESVDELIESGSLGDIFSGGESGGMDFSGDDDESASLDDVVSMLDDE
jgi:hypothetical protein